MGLKQNGSINVVFLVILLIGIILGIFLLGQKRSLIFNSKAFGEFSFAGFQKAYFSKKGDINYDAQYDPNNDGRINARDYAMLMSRFLVRQTPSPTPTPTISPDVYVLEVDDTVDTDDGIRFDKTAQAFYQKYPDKYDFLVIFSSFRPKQDTTVNMHSTAQNEVRGICQPILGLDYDMWHSTRLKGIEQYSYGEAMMRFWLEDPDASGNSLLEETSHQWLVSVGKHSQSYPPGDPPDGINRSCLETTVPLLREDDIHWSRGLQSLPGSLGAMREARPWVDNGNGTYSYDWQSRVKPRKFHPFDLYLMGLVDRSEVKEDYLLLYDIESPDMPPPLNSQLVTTRAKAMKVSIDDIIKIAGEERRPGVKDSQKDFTLAFVILKKPGGVVPEIMLKAINKAALAFPDQWAYATGYRSTINKK